MFGFVGFLSLLAALTPALAASALVNKTVTVSFSLSSAGATRALNVQRVIYVSSKGRVFTRATRELGGASDTTDRGLGTYRIARGKIIGVYQLASGANQMVVSFDPSYSSCTASIQFGRTSRANYQNTLPGGRTLDSSTAPTISGLNCSVREGNPFGE
jgi:hypothetical protein